MSTGTISRSLSKDNKESCERLLVESHAGDGNILAERMCKRCQMKPLRATGGLDGETLPGSIPAFSSETSAFPLNKMSMQSSKSTLDTPELVVKGLVLLVMGCLLFTPRTLLAAMDRLEPRSLSVIRSDVNALFSS